VSHSLSRSVVVPAAPEKVWELVSDFGDLTGWHPLLPPCPIEDGKPADQPGAVRAFTMPDGTVVSREELLAYDAAGRSYSYTLIDPFLPITDYRATFVVRPHADGAEVVWSAVYEGPDEVVAQVDEIFADGVYAAGLASLKDRFAA
jgi:hypothetical protein